MQRLGVPVARIAQLRFRTMAVPPDGFVHRRELDEVRELLCSAAAANTVGITTALRGAGGFGKTTLAQALALDDRVRGAYPDGILWTTMGAELHEGDRLQRVRGLLKWWDAEEDAAFPTLEAASARLRELLEGERVLVVVDDVWQSADVKPFLGGGLAVLVTTRDGRTLPSECGRIHVDAMRRDEAVELLSRRLEGEPSVFEDLAARLGEWPLLLKLVNRELAERVHTDGRGVAEAVREIGEELAELGIEAFDVEDDEARELAVSRTLEVSLRRLGPRDRERFEALAVFPEDAEVPLDVVVRLWSMSPGPAKRICARLKYLSLLWRFDGRTLRLHDVFRRYLIGLQGEVLPDLHRLLLDRCRPPSGR